MRALKMFVDAGLCSSMKDAKRMLKSGALKINDIALDDETLEAVTFEGKIILGNWDGDKFIVHPCSFNKGEKSCLE